MPKTKLEILLRKRVEIYANRMTYKGMLLEVTEDAITLRTDTGFMTIPMDRVSSVREEGAPPEKDAAKYVDRSFYDADLYAPGGNKPEKK